MRASGGTAITLAEQIIDNLDSKQRWALNNVNEPESFPIYAYRVEQVPGTHSVTYSSAIDDLIFAESHYGGGDLARYAAAASDDV